MRLNHLARRMLMGACVMISPSAFSAAAAAVSCADLAKLTLPGVVVTLAEASAAGQYHIPADALRFAGTPGMNVAGRSELGPNPAFCRVAATLKPSADSDIRIEVWLPQSGWNGKLLTAGNFGWAGS